MHSVGSSVIYDDTLSSKMPRLYRANRKKGTMGNSNTDGGRERQDLCVRNRISTSGKTLYYKWYCGKIGGKTHLCGRKSKKT